MVYPPTDVHPAAHGWESNSQPVDHKCDTLTTTAPKVKVKAVYSC